MAACLYNSIRTQYKNVLRNLLDSLLMRQDFEPYWLILQKIMLPSVLVSGSCIFNGQTHDKCKEELVFGMYFDQFEKITELLTDATNLHKNVRILVLLEKKKRIFTQFY